MADLNESQAAQTVKIVGSDSLGAEATFVESSANGDLQVSDVADNAGVFGAITVTTTAIEAKVGASNLANRKNLTLYNNGGATIYFGYANTVTTSTGTPLFKEQTVSFAIGPNLSVWLIASGGSRDVRVTENA